MQQDTENPCFFRPPSFYAEPHWACHPQLLLCLTLLKGKIPSRGLEGQARWPPAKTEQDQTTSRTPPAGLVSAATQLWAQAGLLAKGMQLGQITEVLVLIPLSFSCCLLLKSPPWPQAQKNSVLLVLWVQNNPLKIKCPYFLYLVIYFYFYFIYSLF